MPRKCPRCGYVDDWRDSNRSFPNVHILAVHNNTHDTSLGRVDEARCLCGSCLLVWDEFYNRRDGSRRLVIIGEYVEHEENSGENV